MAQPAACAGSALFFESARTGGRQRFPVVTGAGSHPFPFRTRKLSLLPPMVLQRRLCGRVGRCRGYFEARRRG